MKKLLILLVLFTPLLLSVSAQAESYVGRYCELEGAETDGGQEVTGECYMYSEEYGDLEGAETEDGESVAGECSLLALDREMLTLALRARPSIAGRQLISCTYWNSCNKHRRYFEPILRFMPKALRGLGTLIYNSDIADDEPVASVMARAISLTESYR